MKRFLVFIILSLCIHILIFSFKMNHNDSGKLKKSITYLDTIKKEYSSNPIVDVDSIESVETSDTKIVKDNPAIIKDNPMIDRNLTPEDNIIDDMVIKSKKYTSPPSLMTPSEALKEFANSADKYGPSRQIGDIIRDNMQAKELKEDEDEVSFSDMSFKYESYFIRFAKSLYNEWVYPLESAKKGESGIVRVTFSISKDGTISDINVIESSGYPALDREVMRTLKTMKRTPLPSSFNLNKLYINGYFIYTINGDYRLY